MPKRVQYGINLNPQHPAGRPDDAGKLKGLSWARLVFQVAAAQYDTLGEAFAFYDPFVEKYLAVGVRPLLILNQETFWGSGPWDHGSWDAYAHDFGQMAGQIAAHYKGRGLAYQIWNEGDLPPEHAHSSVPVSPQHFAPVLHQAAVAIKRADPNAAIVFGGLASGAGDAVQYVDAVQETLGGDLPVDAIGVHPYGQWPPAGRPDIPTGWFGPLDATLETYIQGFGGRPVWITEIGISQPGAVQEKHWPAVADYLEAVCTTVERFYADRAPVLIWFAWSDAMREAGITDTNNQPKEPIYSRFFRFARGAPAEVIKEAPAAVSILTPTAEDLKVRRGAGLNHPIIDRVNPGDKLKVLEEWEQAFTKLGRRGQWIQVRSPLGVEGWSAAWYLTLLPQEKPAIKEAETPGEEATILDMAPVSEGLLKNGSFEEPWRDMPPAGSLVNQEPAGWRLKWLEPGQLIWNSDVTAKGVPECVHKLAEQLPPDEQPGGPAALILQGEATYKIFHANQPFGAELRQTVSGLAPGTRGMVKTPIQIKVHGTSDPWAAESGLWINNIGRWKNLEASKSGTWYIHAQSFVVPDSGVIEIVIRVKSKWPIAVDFFIDQVEMEGVPASAMTFQPEAPAEETEIEEKEEKPERTVYTVVSGDTVSAIAVRFNTTVAAIAAANNLVNPSRIRTGQKLIIPVGEVAVVEEDEPEAPKPPAPPEPDAEEHIVLPTVYLNIRSGPGTEHNPPLTMVSPGTPLAVREAWEDASAKVGKDGEWVYIRTPDGFDGWAAAWFVRVPPEPAEGGEIAKKPDDYPADDDAGRLRALDMAHAPVFGQLPVCDPGAVRSFGGFGPNTYSYRTYIEGGDYYRNLSGLHNGVDFGLRVGTRLCAVDWGVVVHVSSREGDTPYAAGPFSVIVRYGDHVAVYGHAAGVQQGVHMFVQAGDVVGPGDPICLSGTANGYDHLHFELRKIDPSYIERLRADAEAAGLTDEEAILAHMNRHFHLRGWRPLADYYINPAPFFTTPLESYNWPNADWLSVDTDSNGYPDQVIRAGEDAPVAYNLYSVSSIPASGPHFWRGSRQA